MLARHVSDLIGPSSGAFCTSCIRRLWYVVILCVLLDTSSHYKVVGLHIYYQMIHGPYNIIARNVYTNPETFRFPKYDTNLWDAGMFSCQMPVTYSHFQYLDRDLHFIKTRMGTTVCSSLGLTSLILRTFKRLPIKWPTDTTISYNISIATCFDLATSSSDYCQNILERIYKFHLQENRSHFLHDIFINSVFLFNTFKILCVDKGKKMG